MRISTKGRYGARAMVDIGENYGKGPVPLKKTGGEAVYLHEIHRADYSVAEDIRAHKE